ncbi:MAG TPA: hypothetical protein VEA69_10490 [Tepidisphaeraceae bacterium]|nr:hypothetical protein [Tepidisphaeraceae bacterium]
MTIEDADPPMVAWRAFNETRGQVAVFRAAVLAADPRAAQLAADLAPDVWPNPRLVEGFYRLLDASPPAYHGPCLAVMDAIADWVTRGLAIAAADADAWARDGVAIVGRLLRLRHVVWVGMTSCLPPSATPTIEEKDAWILEALDAAGRAMSREQIEHAIGRHPARLPADVRRLSVKSIGLRLARLRVAGLVARKGAKSPAAITDAGRAEVLRAKQQAS